MGIYPMNTAEPTIDEQLDNILNEAAKTIANNIFYGTNEEAHTRTKLLTLISDQVAKALEDVYDEQKIWMHEHTELKLGYATYMLTIVKNRLATLNGVKNK